MMAAPQLTAHDETLRSYEVVRRKLKKKKKRDHSQRQSSAQPEDTTRPLPPALPQQTPRDLSKKKWWKRAGAKLCSEDPFSHSQPMGSVRTQRIYRLVRMNCEKKSTNRSTKMF
jgi:hypothetical protein